MRVPSLIRILKASQERLVNVSSLRDDVIATGYQKQRKCDRFPNKLVPSLLRGLSRTTYSPNRVQRRINELETDYTLSSVSAADYAVINHRRRNWNEKLTIYIH